MIRMFRLPKSPDRATFIWLLLSPAIVSLSIYLWKLCGCLGFSHSSMCQMYTPETVMNLGSVDHLKQDYERLMDLNNFKFLLNSDVCNKTNPLLLVVVHSRYNNWWKRQTIRNTWSQVHSDDFQILFLIGEPEYEIVPAEVFEKESRRYGDLVQGNFIDSYRNLTYKHVMGLKWVSEYCFDAKYILKTDDDVFINTPGLFKYLKYSGPLNRGLMRCVPVKNAAVKRSHRSKWRVTFDEYKFRTYPPYCQGLAILYSTDVINRLYEKAQKAKYFWIDDVFVTGMLASAGDILPSSFEPFVLKPDHFYKQLQGRTGEFPYFVGPWNIGEKDMRELWDMVPKIIT